MSTRGTRGHRTARRRHRSPQARARPVSDPRPLTIRIDEGPAVSGILTLPADPIACYVMAHGAGAGMAHPFMAAVAGGLSARRIAVLRYQFPFMESGSKRPDRPALAHATVRAAVREAGALGVPLLAGGKSFGGRMTSQAQAIERLPGVVGLAFFGFPLHPAGKPSVERAEHLRRIDVPLLFLQGTRDGMADWTLLLPLVEQLRAAIHRIDGADHAFHVPARSGQTDEQSMTAALAAFLRWTATLPRPGDPAAPAR